MAAVATSDDKLRAAIAARDGLVDRGAIGRRWGVSRTRVAQLLASNDFPEPVAYIDGRPVWLADRVDAWRDARRPAGRPPSAEQRGK